MGTSVWAGFEVYVSDDNMFIGIGLPSIRSTSPLRFYLTSPVRYELYLQHFIYLVNDKKLHPRTWIVQTSARVLSPFQRFLCVLCLLSQLHSLRLHETSTSGQVHDDNKVVITDRTRSIEAEVPSCQPLHLWGPRSALSDPKPSLNVEVKTKEDTRKTGLSSATDEMGARMPFLMKSLISLRFASLLGCTVGPRTYRGHTSALFVFLSFQYHHLRFVDGCSLTVITKCDKISA